MLPIPTIPQSVATYAALQPDKPAARDSHRSLTYRQWHERANRLANALIGLGLRKGDRVAILAYNCIEWMEIYLALGKAGLIAVPINFRLLPEEIRYIAENCDATAFIVQDELVERVEAIRGDLQIARHRYLCFGVATKSSDYQPYESLIAEGQPHDPNVEVTPTDSWAFMYTSGTTGNPKGAIRSHGSQSSIGLVLAYDMGFARDDTALLVMPMCHVNSCISNAAPTAGASCRCWVRALAQRPLPHRDSSTPVS
jgi:acyl-CoA synthetase (AMP-forming)/AMP-acid ligase II